METKRQLDVPERRLAQMPCVAGQDFSIADIANFPWYGRLEPGRSHSAAEFLDVGSYGHVLDWACIIDVRPAVQRGQKVNRGQESARKPGQERPL